MTLTSNNLFLGLVSLLALMPAPLQAQSELSYLSWQAFPKADYYQGYYDEGSVRRHFRTSSLWILVAFPRDPPPKLLAYNAEGKPLGKVLFASKSVSRLGEGFPSKPSAGVERKGLENKSQGGEVRTRTLSSQEENPDSSERTYDQALSFLDMDDPYASPQVKKQAKKSRKFYKRLSTGHILVMGGLGLEKLASSGGLSSYTGASNIGSTQVQGDFLSRLGFYASARAEEHYFETVDTLKADDSARNEHFQRVSMDLRLGFEGLGNPHGMLIPHLGVSFVKIPGLAEIDPETSFGRFKNREFRAIGLGLRAEAKISDHHGIGGSFLAFPLLGSSALEGYDGETFYRYYFSNSWVLALSFQWSLHQTSFKISCLEIEECQDTSQTSLNGRLWFGGIGYRW